MKKRFTLMMMVLCILMSIPLKMMAETNSEFEKLYLIGGVTDKWSGELNRPFTTTDGETYKYVLVAAESNDYFFRVTTASTEYHPQNDPAPVETHFTSAIEGSSSNAWKLTMTEGKSYTLIFDLTKKQIKYSEGGSEGGSTSPSEKGIQLLNGTTPLTGSNGKYTLDLMRSEVADATITLKIDGVSYGLATAITIDAVGTTSDIAFTTGRTEALTLKAGFIYSLTVTEDGKMTVVAKKGVADGNYYLVGNFFDEDGGDINYEKKYFRFTNSKGDGTLTFDIPASLSIKAQIYTSDGKCYGPADGELGRISKTNPNATDKPVSGSLAAGSNYWNFTDRGLKQIGIYTITITVDEAGTPTAWNVTYDNSKCMAYYLVDPTENPDAVVHPTYSVVKDNHCSNNFFGNIYLEKGQHCFVVSNITHSYSNSGITGNPNITTTKLNLLGNDGLDPTTNVDGDAKAKCTNVAPTKKGFTFNETKSIVLEYNPTRGNSNYAINGIVGEVQKSNSQITDEPIKSVQIVGNGVVDSWFLKDAKEMTYNNKLDCWECTITTNKSESKDNKFRFIANGDWKINWGENSTKSEDQARTPYTDKSKPGHEASLKDPNELGLTKNGTERAGEGTFGDIIFNRPAGNWIIRLYIRTLETTDGNYVFRHACTITESKDIYLTYLTGKFIRTYSNDKPMDPVNNNVKIYEVYNYKNTGGGNADNIYAKGTVYLRQLKYVPANVGVVLIGEADGNTYKDGDQLKFSLLERTETSVEPGGDYTTVWTKSEKYISKGDKWNNYLVPTVKAKNDLGNAEVDGNGNITYRYFGLHHYYSTKRHESLGETDKQPDYIGFFRLTANGRSGANKAYLSIPANKEVGDGVGATYGYIDFNGQLLGNQYEDESTVPAKYANMALVFDDMVDGNETTGIKELETEKMNNNKYYNLQGIEVAHPVKGIYIHNGKKVIVK